MIRSQARFQRVRPAKHLKPQCDLGVVQVQVIAAGEADDLILVGVAALEMAVYDADRLAAQRRLDMRRGITVIMGTGRGHDDRTDSRSGARIARTAHSTHRRGSSTCRHQGLEQRRRLSTDSSTGRMRRPCQPDPLLP